jgi:hypothetical protein
MTKTQAIHMAEKEARSFIANRERNGRWDEAQLSKAIARMKEAGVRDEDLEAEYKAVNARVQAGEGELANTSWGIWELRRQLWWRSHGEDRQAWVLCYENMQGGPEEPCEGHTVIFGTWEEARDEEKEDSERLRSGDTYVQARQLTEPGKCPRCKAQVN